MFQFDLNLLATFDALYELRSTTLAAERLNITQSAVSHALRRLRTAVGDPLFVRGGRTLQPTRKAREMAPEVHEGLTRLRTALVPTTFDPATARRTLTIAAGSYFGTLVAPQLLTWTRATAPGVTLRIVPVSAELPLSLDEGAIDLAVGVFNDIPSRIQVCPLFRDSFVWIAAAGNPLSGRTVSQDEFEHLPKLQIGNAQPFGLPSSLLAGGGIEMRRMPEGAGSPPGDAAMVSGVVYETMTAIAAVGQSDLLAQVPRRLAERVGEQMGIAILDTTEAQPHFEMSAIWHRRSDADLAVAWLLDRLKVF